MSCRDDRMNPAAHEKIADHLGIMGAHGGHDIIQNFVGAFLVKSSFISVRPKIELQRFQLDAFFIRNVFDVQGGKIRLAGFGADAGEFRTAEFDEIFPVRLWIWEDIKVLLRFRGHPGFLPSRRVIGICSGGVVGCVVDGADFGDFFPEGLLNPLFERG